MFVLFWVLCGIVRYAGEVEEIRLGHTWIIHIGHVVVSAFGNLRVCATAIIGSCHAVGIA
jgi:hypothetical protein